MFHKHYYMKKKYLKQKKLKLSHSMNKNNTILPKNSRIKWEYYKKQIKTIKDENKILQKELLNVKEQLLDSEERNADIVGKIKYNGDIVDRQNKKIMRIVQELEYSKAEEKYQRKQKIKTRKRFKIMDEKYKKVMLQNELLETKMNNIQKTIEGISKNTNMNIRKYFEKHFPKIEKTNCDICYDSFENKKIKDKSICQNCCNVSICEDCFSEIKSCPLCNKVYRSKLISSILSDDDGNDYESDGHEDFDYLEEKNETIPVGLMIQDMFSEHWTKEYAWPYRLLHYENLAEGREEETEDDDTEDDHSDDDLIDQRYALLNAPFLSHLN